MKPTITQTQKDTWLAALRSGEIPQIQERMREENGRPGRCCLGVLADLTTSDPKPFPDYASIYLLLGDRLSEECVSRNDGLVFNGPQSFAQIADWLETALVVAE